MQKDPNRTSTYNRRQQKSHVSPERKRHDRMTKKKQSRVDGIMTTTRSLRLQLERTTDARDLAMAQLANGVFSAGHQFLCSSTNVSFVPNGNPAVPEVALIGRQRVGKTSLLRALFKSVRAVGRANTVQRKQAINYFSVGDVFNIADVPGYGGIRLPWSGVLRHAALIRNFARCRPNLKMLYYCMDVHHREGLRVHDVDLLKFMVQEVPNFTIVVTKGDGVACSRDEVTSIKSIKEELLLHDIAHPVMLTSAFHMSGIDTLRYDMVLNAVHTLPTERLTVTEARKLGRRLLTRDEVASVRVLPVVPTAEDDDVAVWNEQVQQEALLDSSSSSGGGPMLLTAGGEATHPAAGDASAAVPRPKVDAPPSLALVPVVGQGSTAGPPAAAASDAHKSLVKKLANTDHLKYVHETSPWRDPLKWPSHVIPTKHPKSNIMKTAEDPTNPYLFQPQFVAPRMDMYFRRPNFGYVGGRKKGQYDPEPENPLGMQYTLPYFPDIVDVAMAPLPWTFVGSREAYYEKSGGRALGIRLTNYALQGQIDPLSDSPAPPEMPLLAAELKLLEAARYGASPIVFLKPRGAAQPQLDGPASGAVAAREEAHQSGCMAGDAVDRHPHRDLEHPPL